ncbi:MAG TPA: FecR family protein [Chryseolinea sp.]|nr:FecR family protein [Chryseolinea sp.]
MTKAELQELLQRSKEGKCSLEEIQLINNWFNTISDESLELNEFEKAHVNKRMLSTIKQELPSATQKTTRPRQPGMLVLKVAASLLFATFLFYLFVGENPLKPSDLTSTVKAGGELVEHKNLTNDILKVQLPDSSKVELKPNSKLSYSEHWGEQKREVRLVGEAFFEVIKDSKRPFYVHGGKIITKVLGTSFTVKAAMNARSIEVEVRTGKVSVYEEDRNDNTLNRGADASGVILTPNEKVEYFVMDKHWVTSLVEEPHPLPATNKSVDFVFSNASMIMVKESIERNYSIDIIIENEAAFVSCTFTGDVSMMKLYDLLDVICKSTGTNYEVKGTKILISGKGCE